jgi:hypothetical protein
MAANSWGLVSVARGDLEQAGILVETWLPRARAVEDPQMLLPALTLAAQVDLARGEGGSAHSVVEEMAEAARGVRGSFAFITGLEALRAYVAAGRPDLGRSLFQGDEGTTAHTRLVSLTGRAILSEVQGDLEEAAESYRSAAEAWHEFGNVPEHGQALLGRGRCLIALKRGGEAREPLKEAWAVFEGLGARPLVKEIDRLLGVEAD